MPRIRRTAHRLTPRPLRRSIGVRVAAGFLLTAALASLVAFVSLAYSTSAGRDLAESAERDRRLSADFRDLEIAVEQQSGAVQNFLLSGDERDLEALEAGRQRFRAAWARLEGAEGAPRGDALDDLRRQAEAFDEISDEMIGLSRQGWNRAANFLWRTDGQDTKHELVTAVRRLVAEHNAAVDREIVASRARLRLVQGVSIGLVLLAFALALMVGMAITRAVTRPVRDLMRVAAAVRNGNLSVRAPVRGEDELAVLSLAMNAMVQSLAASRADLERALAETERSEQRYRVLTENANDIVFALDAQNRFTFVNPAVRETLGYEPEELLGRPVEMLFTDMTGTLLTINGIYAGAEPGRFSADLEVRARDGRVVPIGINVSVLYAGDTPAGIHGIARDMTERFRMEQELRRLHAQGQRRVDQLVTVNEIGRKIAALQPLETLLPQLVQIVGRTFGYHHVRILLVSDDGTLETAAAWPEHGADDLPRDRAAPAADAEPTAATAADAPGEATTPVTTPAVPFARPAESLPVPAAWPLDDGVSLTPLVLRALEGDAGWVAGSGRPEDDASRRFTEVAVPVRTKSRVLGVLDIRGGVDEPLDESDIFTLQTLADQIAVAIENARLYETGQQLAVSEERNRLARELHDSVTQELFSMTMMAGALPTLIKEKPDRARERAERLYGLARGALAEMRSLLITLRPAALAEMGLVQAVTTHAAGFENQESIKTHVEIDGEGRLPLAVEEALFRVMQEALNNIAKHARAKNVWIALAIDDDETVLSVKDDGIGMVWPPAGGSTGMGIRNMRERVALLGGSLTVESAPGAGMAVHVHVPVGKRAFSPDAAASLPPARADAPASTPYERGESVTR